MNWHDELRSRIRRASWRPLSEDTRRLHRERIDEAIRSHVPAAEPRHGRRRLATVILVATLGLLPAGLAIAAESSVPGDLLFPIKRATEAVRGLVDSDVAAEHRVEELERLVDEEAAAEVIAEQADKARLEVDRLASDHALRPRLSDVLAVADRRDPDEKTDEIVADDRPASGTTTTATIAPPPTDSSLDDRPTDTQSEVPMPSSPPTTTRPPETTTVTTLPTVETVPRDEAFPVRGLVHAGPTCPVQKDPPDPDCEDIAVAGAMLVFKNEKGDEVVRIPSGPNGEIRLRLPAGTYLVEPQPVDGLLGTAPPQEFELGPEGVNLDIAYDTGIR